MEPVHQPVEDDAGEVVRIVVADLQPGENLLALAVDLFRCKCRVPCEIGNEIEREAEAVLHDSRVDEGDVAACPRANRAANRIDRGGDLLGAPGCGALIEKGRRHIRHPGLARWILRAAGPDEQSEADGWLLMM